MDVGWAARRTPCHSIQYRQFRCGATSEFVPNQAQAFDVGIDGQHNTVAFAVMHLDDRTDAHKIRGRRMDTIAV
jgi:hypothetical protein